MNEAEMEALRDLAAAIASATGSDRALDRAVAETLAQDPEIGYSASVDACLALLHAVLPGWAWHIGYGPLGIMPYAVVQRDEQRYEASAATVPLALLDAIVQAAADETLDAER